MGENAVCKVCGRPYKICGHCPSSASLSYQPWRRICDTSDCYGMYLAVWGYNVGQVSKEEAKSQLEKCDLSKMELETFDQSMKKTINKIMSTNRLAKKNKMETKKSVDNTQKEDDVANDKEAE